jgi:hypothetical protein
MRSPLVVAAIQFRGNCACLNRRGPSESRERWDPGASLSYFPALRRAAFRNILIVFVSCAVLVMASPAQTFTTLVNFDGTNGAIPLASGSLIHALAEVAHH